MMRKLSVLVLLTVYSATAIGVPLHYHYCEGELQHVSILFKKACASHEEDEHTDEVPTACCTSKDVSHCEESKGVNNDCCDNESDLVQIGDEFVGYTNVLPDDISELIWSASETEVLSTYLEELVSHPTHGPPGVEVKKYLAHCSFVFYG